MNALRIALAQFDFPVGAVAGNRHRIGELMVAAREQHRADIVLFPELAICGYPPEDLLLRPSFLAACEQALAELARQSRGVVVVVGHPLAVGSVVFNAVSVLRDGRIAHTCRKQELPNYAVFDERRYFAVGDGSPCLFELAGVRIGVLICEDLWHADPLARLAEAGAELVLVANASPFERGKTDDRDALLLQRARESGVALAYLNLVGGQDELVFDGSACLADGDGVVHPPAEAFAEHLLLADYHPGQRRFQRLRWPIETDPSFESLAWRAIVTGIRDYLGKNGFSEVLLGLSGGIDSALVLALAVDALGAERVRAVRLPSRYTSTLSNDLAERQCRALGVALDTASIEAPFAAFQAVLAPLFAGRPTDVTEENLQSRCRGTLLMALANKFGAMLLTTGNKSEYAVGYATIYGDMCGGYAPIKDLYKTEVFALARWRNRCGDGERIPDAVIVRPPTAELRDGQLDQDSLPPYEVLDAILRTHIDGEASSEEIVALGFAAATVAQVVRLVKISEWKRRQAAPGPKVSRRAFGRERRYPISSDWSS